MKPTVWVIVSSISVSTLIVLIISKYGTSLTIEPVAWDIVVSMFFCLASISFSVLIRLITKWWDHRVEDLGVAVVTLCRMQVALRRLDPLLSSEKCIEWLKSVDDLQGKEEEIKVGYDGCGLNYSKRRYFSTKAGQELNRAHDLLRQGDNLLHPQHQLRGTMSFYRKKVIDFIEDMGAQSGLLGIWGMGGVGKSSLLKLVCDSRSEYDNDSFEVLFVRAGIGCTVGEVQEAIATSMGLPLMRDKTSQRTRANIIQHHLNDRSFLLLLDDLWGYLDLKDVGIPSPLGTSVLTLQGGVVRQIRRKVVFTTRMPDVCRQMRCGEDYTIKMTCLDEEDAWELYRKGWAVVINRGGVVAIQADKLLPEVEARPHTVCDVQPQHLQDRLPGMMGSYQKVIDFIEGKGGAESLLLGVSGKRGVGKTALLRLVRDSYTGDDYFDHILFVGAGTGCMVNNVQHAIAINLGLDWSMMSSLDELSRAMDIFDNLQHKNFLLLLDDIREPLNWWAVGLPILSPRKRQKIILATRSRAVCALMGCDAVNTIEMRCLGKDDAWNLFRDKVGLGIIDADPQIHHLAKKMVSMCKGLPLALCSLGRAMSNKRDPREWRSAYYYQLVIMRLKRYEIDEMVGSFLNS